MTKEVSSTAGFCPWVLSFQSLSVCNELAACIQAIWNRISACLSALSQWVHSGTASRAPYCIATRSPKAHDLVMRFLRLEDVGRCERVCKSWKVSDEVWKWQCQLEQVGYELPEGRHKEAFSNPQPPEAFGLEAWREHFKVELDPETVPRLPARIHRQLAQRKETHILTLKPEFIGDQPLSLKTFVPVVERAGMKLGLGHRIPEAFGEVPAGPSHWIWVRKEITFDIRRKIEKADLAECGDALDIVVSFMGHYARHKVNIFPRELFKIVTRNEKLDSEGQRWFVSVAMFDEGTRLVYVLKCYPDRDSGIGNTSVVSADALK